MHGDEVRCVLRAWLLWVLQLFGYKRWILLDGEFSMNPTLMKEYVNGLRNEKWVQHMFDPPASARWALVMLLASSV